MINFQSKQIQKWTFPFATSKVKHLFFQKQTNILTTDPNFLNLLNILEIINQLRYLKYTRSKLDFKFVYGYEFYMGFKTDFYAVIDNLF
jgi:hypothetical protein